MGIVNRSAPPGEVVPGLYYDDVDAAIDWLCGAFGFTERYRYGPPDHTVGAFLNVGGSSVALSKARVGQPPDCDDTTELRPPRGDFATGGVSVRTTTAPLPSAREPSGRRRPIDSASASTPPRTRPDTAGRSPSQSWTLRRRTGGRGCQRRGQRGAARTGWPGRASGTSSPSRTTKVPPTITWAMPDEGRVDAS
jgi:hypothetical protein